MNKEIINKLVKDIKRLEKREIKLYNTIHSKKEELKNICDHTETEIKKHYISGGYLDREEFHSTEICKICGTEINHNMTYGGFC